MNQRYSRAQVTDLVVATPVFLDLTFVGLESLPSLGEEKVRPRVGRVVLPAGRGLPVRSRRLQRHQPLRAVRPGTALPEGWELWRNDEASWRVFPETDPHWQWTEGLRHLVDCVESGRPTVTRPEHAYHALEIMLAAQAAGGDGVAREIESGFPDPVYDPAWLEAESERHVHDRRSHEGMLDGV